MLTLTRPPSVGYLLAVHPTAARIIEQSGKRCCKVCGRLLSSHPRCRRCGILAGPGHATTELLGGVCEDCAGR